MNFRSKIVFPLLLLGLASLGNACSERGSSDGEPSDVTASEVSQDVEAFTLMDLDDFIKTEQASVAKLDGKKLIAMMKPVRFTAKMKRQPEEREMAYVYTAMGMAGTQPLPKVGHRMFVESTGGTIIPVYVEQKAVAKLNEDLEVEGSAQFLGYHVFSNSKGPAVLVVDFVSAKTK